MKARLLLAWGHGSQMPNARSKSTGLAGSRGPLEDGDPGTRLRRPQPAPPRLSIPLPEAVGWQEICSSAAAVWRPFRPRLRRQGDSLALPLPVLGSDLLETSGTTPWSRCMAGICRCQGAAESLSGCRARREGGCKHAVAPCGARCCGRAASPAASPPGSLAPTAPRRGSAPSPRIVRFPAENITSAAAADGRPGRQTEESFVPS